MKQPLHFLRSLVAPLMVGAYAVWALTAELSMLKVIITGLAIQAVTYSTALLRDDWAIAVEQQRTLSKSGSFPKLAIWGAMLSLNLYTLALAISLIPQVWAGQVMLWLLALTDGIVLSSATLLMLVRSNIRRPVANIAQHEFAVVNTIAEKPVLRTRNVRWCTTWYGWDSEHRMAFMAHFDRPASAKNITPIVDEMLKHVSPGATLHTVVEGGYRSPLFGLGLFKLLNLSYNTRQALRASIQSESRLTLSLTDGAYTIDGARARFKKGLPVAYGRWGRDMSLHTDTHMVTYELLTGDLHPRRSFLSKPMLRSEKIG